MSKINYYGDVKVIKRPVKKRLKSFFIFLVIIVIFVSCFFTAKYLSDALTVGNISNIFVYGGKSVKINSCTMYAVILGEYSGFEDAEKVGLGSNVQGASGYVWESDTFWVIGNIYTSKIDASSVIENLKESNYQVAIKEITFPKLNLDFGDYENKQVSEIKYALELIDKIYNTLYDYSIKFDKSKINNLAISSGVSDLRGEVKISISSMQNLLKTPNNDIFLIQNALIKLDELLNQTTLKTLDNLGTNYILKNSISVCVRIKYELYNSLVN